jgi:hypothetical protein
VTYTLFLIRNSGVLDSGGGVLAKASQAVLADFGLSVGTASLREEKGPGVAGIRG